MKIKFLTISILLSTFTFSLSSLANQTETRLTNEKLAEMVASDLEAEENKMEICQASFIEYKSRYYHIFYCLGDDRASTTRYLKQDSVVDVLKELTSENFEIKFVYDYDLANLDLNRIDTSLPSKFLAVKNLPEEVNIDQIIFGFFQPETRYLPRIWMENWGIAKPSEGVSKYRFYYFAKTPEGEYTRCYVTYRSPEKVSSQVFAKKIGIKMFDETIKQPVASGHMEMEGHFIGYDPNITNKNKTYKFSHIENIEERCSL